MYYICTMKQLIILITSLLTFSVNAQDIDYNNFDNKLLERLVFEELNKYRDSLGVENLLFSQVMYKNITCKQTEILAKGCSLYHPNLVPLLTDEVRTSISKESEKLTGIKSLLSGKPSAVSIMRENGYSTDIKSGKTYQQLAKRAVIAWDQSFLHKCTQKAVYIRDGGKGLVSVSARMNNSKTKIFIFCNFTYVYKENN